MVVVVLDVDVSVTVDVSGTVEVVVDVLGVVVVEVEVVDGVVVEVVDEVVEELVVLEDEVVSPLSSLETTASATPRPMTAAARIASSAFTPPLIPCLGGSPGGWP